MNNVTVFIITISSNLYVRSTFCWNVYILLSLILFFYLWLLYCLGFCFCSSQSQTVRQMSRCQWVNDVSNWRSEQTAVTCRLTLVFDVCIFTWRLQTAWVILRYRLPLVALVSSRKMTQWPASALPALRIASFVIVTQQQDLWTSYGYVLT